MNSAWSLELLRLFILSFSILIVGLATQAWILTIIIHIALYLVWVFIQVKAFEGWISRGAHTSDAPDNSGIWQQMVQHIYRSQRSHAARKKQLASKSLANTSSHRGLKPYENDAFISSTKTLFPIAPK